MARINTKAAFVDFAGDSLSVYRSFEEGYMSIEIDEDGEKTAFTVSDKKDALAIAALLLDFAHSCEEE